MSKPVRATQPEQDENGNVFGAGDTEKLYPFPKGWLGRVVVRQVEVVNLPSNTIVEDPSTVRIMNYEVATFNALQKNEGFGATQIKILHDPR